MNKVFFRDYFFKNIHNARHHKTDGSELTFWLKLFDTNEVTDSIIEDLNLKGLSVLPRFSYQLKNTKLDRHIDIDRIVGINLNLMEEPATIHINNVPYEYEAALIDVGTKLHSIEPISTNRLVIKLAIRNQWDEIYCRLKEKNLLKTSADTYISHLRKEDTHLVKL